MEGSMLNIAMQGGSSAVLLVVGIVGYFNLSTRLTVIETILKTKHACHRENDED